MTERILELINSFKIDMFNTSEFVKSTNKFIIDKL